MFRSITNLIWGNSSEKGSVLFEILNFTLYKQNQETHEKSLVYKNATLSLQNSSPQAHKYNIEFSNESDAIISVPIDDEFFAQVDVQNNILLGHKDEETCWFAATGSTVNEPTIKTFRLLLAQCLFEWTNKKPHTEASEEQLEALIRKMSAYSHSALNISNVPLGEEVHKSIGNCSLFIFDKKTRSIHPKINAGDCSYT